MRGLGQNPAVANTTTGNPIPGNNSDQCPACGGAGIIKTPDGTLYQMCPLCQGTGIFLGVGSFYHYAVNLTLTATATPGTPGATQIGTILIQQNKDFRWVFAIAQRTGAFQFSLDINGNQFQTVFNSVGQQGFLGLSDKNFWGSSADNPFPLPIPILIPAYNRLNITAADTSGATNTVNFSIIGAHFDIGTTNQANG